MNRRLVAVVGFLVLVVTGALLGTTGTLATWTDTATVRSANAAFTSGTVAPASRLGCRNGSAASGSVVMEWDYPDSRGLRGFRVVATKTSGHRSGTVLLDMEVPALAREQAMTRDLIPEATLRDQWAVLWMYYQYRVDVYALHESGWTSTVVSREGQVRHNSFTGHYCR